MVMKYIRIFLFIYILLLLTKLKNKHYKKNLKLITNKIILELNKIK